jgi:Peptidase family M28
MQVYEHLLYLVNRCGARRVGTLGNRLAAEYITRVMESAGYTCDRERFSSPAGIQAPNAAIMLMGFTASLLLSGRGRLRRGAGLACAALMGAAFLGENTTLGPFAHHLVPRREGGNVVARRRRSGPPGVLVVAHFDTVNEGTAFNARWVGFVRAGFFTYAAFPFLAVALAYSGRRWPGRVYRLAMLAGAFGLIQWLLLGRYNAGANDNGSGVAVALSAAEALGAGGEPPADLWFLFTDGEEAGVSGMQAFIEEHGSEVENTLIVNLESLGSGRLCYFGSEGPLVRFRPPAALTGMLESYAAETGVELHRVGDSALATDALAALARGFSAVTFTRVDSSGLIPGWHYKDYIENLDCEVLEETADFVAGLVGFLCGNGARE